MKPILLGAALAALALPLAAALPAHADGSDITYNNTDFGSDSAGTSADSSSNASYPFAGRNHFVVEGSIRHLETGRNRFEVLGDDAHRYNVDVYDSDIRLGRDGQEGDASDLHRGMRVRITGRLLGVAFVEAEDVRALPPTDSSAPAPQTAADVTVPLTPAPDLPLPDNFPPVPASPALEGTPVNMEAVVTQVDADGRHITVLNPNDKYVTADTLGSDIILRNADQEGQFTDLTRGMHIRLIGTQAPDGMIQADRIRVEAGTAPATTEAVTDPVPAPSVPVDVDLSQFTGILIDARSLPGVMRSPAPTIIGPDGTLLYPDRAHVPTPDEVQDESIVRYYHSLDEAEQGVAGPHPLILTAAAVVGPASDGVQLSESDAALLQALDKRLRFTRTWKVGFLIPDNR